MKHHLELPDQMSFQESHDVDKHGLHGHVSVYRRNKKTGEVALWYENDNIIPISGMSWTLMKMFGLYLDSKHGVATEQLDRDTTLITPDLNDRISIGVDPENYTTMTDDISASHFIQGFMVGNGGSGEDQMTTKNTDYSFVCLRNPIPFRQSNTQLNDETYLGKYRLPGSFTYSYYIKRFDERPHIVHSWWRDGQKWDYVNPVTPDDLGPNAVNGQGVTNRIETYAECQMSLGDGDCETYFAQQNNNQTPVINELGLVAFDTTANAIRTSLAAVYQTHVKPMLNIIFNGTTHTTDENTFVKNSAAAAITEINEVIASISQSNIATFVTTLESIANADVSSMNYATYQTELRDSGNIEVVPYYTETAGQYQYEYETDQFMNYLEDSSFDNPEEIEAQRIKLITYYTFKAIPIEENWETLINYRIYAN